MPRASSRYTISPGRTAMTKEGRREGGREGGRKDYGGLMVGRHFAGEGSDEEGGREGEDRRALVVQEASREGVGREGGREGGVDRTGFLLTEGHVHFLEEVHHLPRACQCAVLRRRSLLGRDLELALTTCLPLGQDGLHEERGGYGGVRERETRGREGGRGRKGERECVRREGRGRKKVCERGGGALECVS